MANEDIKNVILESLKDPDKVEQFVAPILLGLVSTGLVVRYSKKLGFPLGWKRANALTGIVGALSYVAGRNWELGAYHSEKYRTA